ncbi:MAG TPA: hypothetical protein VJ302_20185 [Blastocatellia bacterium]|nr:hypothetical protein [Blastocatellia bacterium]
MPGRVSVTIDGTKFNAIEAVFSMSTQKDAAGMPVLSTLNTTVKVWADVFDDKNVPFATIQKLFGLGNVPNREKIKDIKVEYWKDDTMQDVICSYKFKGWISLFELYNPVMDLGSHPMVKDARDRVYNHIMHLELTPVINKENFQEVAIGN